MEKEDIEIEGNNAPSRKNGKRTKQRKGGRKRHKAILYQKRIKKVKKLGEQRVIALLELAMETFRKDKQLANRYVRHAREIAMGLKIRIPREYKRYICHGCKNLLMPGENMRIRTVHRKGYGSYIRIECLDCGHVTRYIFKGPMKIARDKQKRDKHARKTNENAD